MANEEWEKQLQEIEEQIYSYKECDEKGHFWYKLKAEWFRYGWRWPWRTKVRSKKCGGCGWVEYNSRPRRWRRR
jgi:hypothetical protein